jgi:outer membrane protein OmpA-like peptidoglycan-associated protein
MKAILSLSLLYILSVLIAPLLASGQHTDRATYKVSGNVFGDRDKKPKAEVCVIAYSVVKEDKTTKYYFWEDNQTTFTNSEGKFELNLYGDTDYVIHFIKDGYTAKPQSFSKRGVVSGEKISIDVPMYKSNYGAYKGQVIDQDNGKGLEYVNILFTDQKNNIVMDVYTDKEGYFYFAVEENANYTFEVSKEGYFHLLKIDLDAKKLNTDGTYKRIGMEEIRVGRRGLLGIYPFEVNDDTLRKERESELIKLYRMLLLNPRISLEIGCHTDSRGDDDYNLKLSQKRAEAVVAYLIKKGIPPHRVSAVGYGETGIINECINGVRCSNEKHLVNRRLEFIVTAYDEEADKKDRE